MVRTRRARHHACGSRFSYLRRADAWVTVMQGMIFMICALVLRRGIIGGIGAFFRLAL